MEKEKKKEKLDSLLTRFPCQDELKEKTTGEQIVENLKQRHKEDKEKLREKYQVIAEKWKAYLDKIKDSIKDSLDNLGDK